MKTTNYIHFFIQLIFALLVAAILIGSMALENGDLFLMLYLAIPLGIYQLLSSIIHVIGKGGKSPLTIHLILSALHLLFFYFGANNILTHGSKPIEELLAIGVPSILALYSFVIAFTKLNPFILRIKEKH